MPSCQASPGGAAPAHPPSLYVEALFDEYADEFQTHLVEHLNYQAHNTLLAPLRTGGQRRALALRGFLAALVIVGQRQRQPNGQQHAQAHAQPHDGP